MKLAILAPAHRCEISYNLDFLCQIWDSERVVKQL